MLFTQARRGMWVVSNSFNAIGILWQFINIENQVMAELHIVDINTGVTIQEVIVPFSDIRQATLEEIPACRKKHPEQFFRKLGY